MNISKNWLKKYVEIPDSLDAESFAEKLTLHTVEVDGFEDKASELDNIVVGEVKTVEKHPDADKLSLCEVYDGENDIMIVCGGSNLRVGMKVALGKIGAKVRWHGEGDLIELKKTKIRGVASFGMICAADEIGLGAMYPSIDEKEIVDISDVEADAGISLAVALGIDDVVFDVDNKSMTHRPDLWGNYGMAREVAAMQKTELKPYTPEEIVAGSDMALSVSVEDTDLCPRYSAVAMEGITVGESPKWLKELLLAVGIRPINNIVDITNYVMHDLGQPMHAFDASMVELPLSVRKAKAGEEFISLDGGEHKLTEEMLVIADAKKAVALAGVMGGKTSEITDSTTTIIFESANFKAVNIRRTSMKLGLRTDSSSRFEKSLDPENTMLALKRAVELTKELCPNVKVVSNVIDEKEFTLNQGPIELTQEFLDKKIGMAIEKETVVQILESLGFGVEVNGSTLSVTIPTWRATKDISIREDLVEEIARMYGYDNITPVLPVFPVMPPEENRLRSVEHAVREVLALHGAYTEVYNYSFVSGDWLEKIGIATDKYIELENPMQKDRPFLRRTLFANMLVNVEKNLHREDAVRFFEIGQTYIEEEVGEKSGIGEETLPRQDVMLGVAYSEKDVDVPFFHVKGIIESIANTLGIEFTFESMPEVHEYMHGGRSAHIFVKGNVVGRVFEVHPRVSDSLGIDPRVAVAEINLSKLVEYIGIKQSYTRLSAYPEVLRDLAFVVDAVKTHDEVSTIIYAIDPLIVSVELFDVYQGSHIEEGKKSMAYRMMYRSEEKTLTTEEVDNISACVVKALEDKAGAVMRG
ncbi:MAG: phenylalanine--tRNA ligase subunit beta [Candidatus Magasanikbacteria bacterium]|nr:phenylalanine--tRNA ligase subunit beta [Candidatus Magasanikbacteria bacterium]MBT4071243.1 phenylalanine--tRNA ligase subunit beta [Candidatus Magasanikbacteria bacterium]